MTHGTPQALVIGPSLLGQGIMINLTPLFLPSRVGHVRIYPLNMILQPRRSSLCRRTSFERGEEVDHSEENVADLKVRPLRER